MTESQHMQNQQVWDHLLTGEDKYISLGTHKRDGSIVRTPVWFVTKGSELIVTTQGSSGKAKRVRNFPEVDLATCDMRGNIKGPIISAAAQQIPDSNPDIFVSLFKKKYGLMFRLMSLRGSNDRVFIRVSRNGFAS